MKKTTINYLKSRRYNPLIKFKHKRHNSKKEYKRIKINKNSI